MLFYWLSDDPTPTQSGPGFLLRAPKPKDYEKWRHVRQKSYVFLKPFEPRWTERDLSKDIYFARLRHSKAQARAGTEFTFFIMSDAREPELLGGMTLSNVRRRVSMHANIGYWMSAEQAGKGVMTRALGAILPFVFNDLKLHRLNAACLPHNIASRRVLEKNGFEEEGFAKGYLKIDGEWRDHALYGLTEEHFRGVSVRV